MESIRSKNKNELDEVNNAASMHAGETMISHRGEGKQKLLNTI